MAMQKEDTSHSLRIYTGTEVTINLLRSELENAGISSMVRSDLNSGVASGSYGGFPSDIELYIREEDLKKAKPILDDFMEINR
jgi:hypothetical protein